MQRHACAGQFGSLIAQYHSGCLLILQPLFVLNLGGKRPSQEPQLVCSWMAQRWLYDLPKHHFWIPVVSCCIGQEREDSTEASCNIAYGYPTWLGCIESSLDFFLNFKKNPSTFPAIMPPGLFALRALFYCRPCRPAAQRGASPASASAAAQRSSRPAQHLGSCGGLQHSYMS